MDNENNTQYQLMGLFLQFPHLDYIKMKEKDCCQLKHIISKSRLNDKISFLSYGNITVDETGQYMNIKYIPEFTRKNISALIWSITEPKKYGYDYLIIIMHKVHNIKYYDYLLYNIRENKCTGHFYKSSDISEIQDINLPSSCLLTDLNISFNRMENSIKLKNRLLNKY